MPLPPKGRPKEEIFAELERFKTRDLDWRAGRVWAYVYNPGDEVREVVNQAYTLFLTENALDPTVFPSLLRLEREVVRMVADLLQGDENVVGHITTGGTESNMLAVKTARDWARAHRPEVAQPEMVLPITAHASFHKAAHYLCVRPVVVEVNPHTFRVEPEAMQAAITPNTILLVASAPNWSQGVIDPIPEIAEIARERGLLFHVDACVGGFYLSFLRRMGYPVPDFDFAVPGVTSISADLHKYGYAAKGASTILYRHKEIRRYQLFACAETTAYTLINTTMLSSKSGGPMAGAWAVLNYLGEEGFMHIVQTVHEATQRLIRGINEIPELRVLGEPAMCIFSFTSDQIHLFQLADAMARRGWYIQAQPSTPFTPRSLHISVNYGNAHQVDALLADLREAVEEVKRATPIDTENVRAMIAWALQSPDPQEAFRQLMGTVGIVGTELPEELALINEILDLLPDPLADALLVDYFNDLYV
ncbi:MAG: pyridoxal phosphate-dependent decarboxylase family protein [Anaerolineae bacterium]|jgi:glutamate/tyrosine decarboxylase-like PLP-dependent enzyme